eukprot:TRINITY_DN20975_c3_g1_i2.p1 TRINITY_DN20975_c3_g1~~TRINITY_DN20975_c3_g1_i2.p1  ORF type:complete len:890 (-),score=155.90 TRINITY_DN20975_c3_g1_i2:105-2510(-)
MASKPWMADPVAAQSSVVRPFATTPSVLPRSRNGVRKQLPCWDESFLIAETLEPGSALLFEVLDVVVDSSRNGNAFRSLGPEENEIHLLPIGWGFLSVDTALSVGNGLRPRRLRLQLYRYRRRGWGFGRFRRSEEEEDAGMEELEAPGVAREYLAAGFGQPPEMEPGLMATALAALTGRLRGQREHLAAVLEITLTQPPKPVEIEKAAAEMLQSRLSDASLISHTSSVAAAMSPLPQEKAEAEAANFPGKASEGHLKESLGKLQPQNIRHDEQSCVMPDSLLSQIAVGKRGASRMAISPSGKLLAVAVSKPGKTAEVKVLNLTTGRVYANCASGHDALVYDLCWHAFTGYHGAVPSPPLLMSCGGDGVVNIYEVPEDLSPMNGMNPPLLRLHARISLPSHAYSVRAHPSLASDPRRLVLLIGGHNFGLVMCELSRYWKQAEPGDSGGWVVHTPHWQEQVNYEANPLRPQGASSEPASSSTMPKADVLCVRFSPQATQPDSLYVTDAAGHVMLFQITIDPTLDAGRGGVRANLVRSYVCHEIAGTAVYDLEVVTKQLLQGKRLSSVQLSMVDDWVLLFSRDHIIRLASLQRGVLKIELEMTGLECVSYPVRGTMSPDAAYVACGSETGELLVWNATDGKRIAADKLPQVRLAGPVMDVVWAERYHLMACCALDDQAPPLLVFVGKDPDQAIAPSTPPRRQAQELQHRPVPLRDAPRDQLELSKASIGIDLTPGAPSHNHKWASTWIHSETNPRSAVTQDEKRKMKENILLKLLEQKGAENIENHLDNSQMTLHNTETFRAGF